MKIASFINILPPGRSLPWENAGAQRSVQNCTWNTSQRMHPEIKLSPRLSFSIFAYKLFATHTENKTRLFLCCCQSGATVVPYGRPRRPSPEILSYTSGWGQMMIIIIKEKEWRIIKIKTANEKRPRDESDGSGERSRKKNNKKKSTHNLHVWVCVLRCFFPHIFSHPLQR